MSRKNLIICRICQDKLVSPVDLPCGETICERHVKIEELKIIKCVNEDCKEGEHEIEESGFEKNLKVEEILNKSSSKRQEMTKDSMNKFDLKLIEIEALINNSELFIYRYFQQIRNEIDIKAETMKKEIDDQRDEYLKEIKTFENECYQKAKEKDNLQYINDCIGSIRGRFQKLNEEVNKLLLKNEKAK